MDEVIGGHANGLLECTYQPALYHMRPRGVIHGRPDYEADPARACS